MVDHMEMNSVFKTETFTQSLLVHSKCIRNIVQTLETNSLFHIDLAFTLGPQCGAKWADMVQVLPSEWKTQHEAGEGNARTLNVRRKLST